MEGELSFRMPDIDKAHRQYYIFQKLDERFIFYKSLEDMPV
jgi:hypothetical protein